MALKHQVGKAEGPRTRIPVTIEGGNGPEAYAAARAEALAKITETHGKGKHGKTRTPVRVRTVRISETLIARTFVFEV